MDRTQGYLLPSGSLGDDDISCTVVFYPDRPEYRAALQGSLAYLATWIAWEKDDDKRGKDAADNWREAYVKTLECWQMGCFDSLTEDIHALLLLMQSRKDCCDDNITYGEQEEITTTIEPGVGDPPDYYGETAITDWDDWGEHVCYNAHAYVDMLKAKANDMESAVSTSSMYIGLIAAALTLLAFTGIGLPIAYTLGATVLSGLVFAVTETTFANTATSIEAARNDIVCALLQGDSIADAVEDALSSGTDWDLFYKYVPYESATAIIYEGGYDGEYLPADTKDDCATCGYDLLDDTDVTIHVPSTYGEDLEYLGAGLWYIDSQAHSCQQIWMEFYTDVSKTTRLDVRFELVSCNAADTNCGGAANYRGWDNPGPVVIYSLDHDVGVSPDDGVINAMYMTHNNPSFEITFRLYAAS